MMPEPYDVVCLCHLRWDFVYQRPQHLMRRFSRRRRTFFVDGLAYTNGAPYFEVSRREDGLTVATPYVPPGLPEADLTATLRRFIDGLFAAHAIRHYVLWYYTPLALGATRQLLAGARAVVYDCMDELSMFGDAVAELERREAELFRHADLVFTGGQSLYAAKRHRHPRIYAFPSSIDAAHFAAARAPLPEPADQAAIAHPRIGYYGVIDERLDLGLLDAVAAARPNWQLVMVGPVVKIDAGALPRRDNIHYLGQTAYGDLPAYLAGWAVAMMPFAHNDATRFISPTKTLEYLAAGKPVVSTSIRDVVHPYGEQGLVRIADTAAAFVTAVEAALGQDHQAHLRNVDAMLATTSWEHTWQRMAALVDDAVVTRQASTVSPPVAPAVRPSLPDPVAARPASTDGETEPDASCRP